MGSKTYTTRLHNLVVYAYHGVHPEEKTLGQRFEIDIEFTLANPPQPWRDDLQSTVSYVNLIRLAVRIAEREKFDLIETLADRMVEEVRKHPLIASVTIRVRKPSVPIQGVVDYVEVEVNWEGDSK